MISTARAVSARLFVPPITHLPKAHLVLRKSIPPAIWSQQCHFGTFTDQILFLLTGMKRLNPEETRQAIIDHQKLWVAHYAINNHLQAHKHYEMFYSMQLFKEPKNEIQQLFIGLVDKKKEELSSKELQNVIDLFEFALERNQDIFAAAALQKKLDAYRSLLRFK